MKTDKKQSLQRRARRFATVLNLMLSRQGCTTGSKVVRATRAARHLSLNIRLANSNDLDKALKLQDKVALSANVQHVIALRQSGVLTYQFELSQGFWEFYTRQDLSQPECIGLGDNRQPVDFNFGTFPHALVAGATGAGKTETLKSILISLMTTFTPDELKLIVIDQKNVLGDFSNESHLVLPIAIETDEVTNALEVAYSLLVERKRAGNTDDYRLIVAIDEVSLLPDIERLQMLAKLGREYNIHCIVGNQRASQKDLPKILDNLNNRYVGLVDNAQTSAMLTGHSGLMAHKLTGQGDFLHVQGGSCTRFQVAQTTVSDFERLERSEVQPVIAEPVEAIIPDQVINPVGRPKLEVQPDKVGYYLYHNPEKISRAMAHKILGLSQRSHYLHRDFTREIVSTIRELKGVTR